jgi:hypothetical protein
MKADTVPKRHALERPKVALDPKSDETIIHLLSFNVQPVQHKVC